MTRRWTAKALGMLGMLPAFWAGCSIKEPPQHHPHGPSTSSRVDSSPGDSSAAKSLPPPPSGLIWGRLTIDGSSTVYPITQAVAEEFHKRQPKVVVTVGISGTGSGMKRFVVGDLDLCDASRPMEPSEAAECQARQLKYLELKIAMDGISIVVNARNTWCKALTLRQLRALWNKDSTIRKWSDLDPGFPDREIVFYGPDTDSGTFDYFTAAVCGKRGNSRSGAGYSPSSDDNVLIQGIVGDEGSLGYLGYAYYVLNKDAVRAVPISAGSEPLRAIEPTEATILDGTYCPLSRPLFLYVNKNSLLRPETVAFLSFYLANAPTLVREVHYIPLTEDSYRENCERLAAALTEVASVAGRLP